MKFSSFWHKALPINKQQIEQAIEKLEALTSAELRVVVERQIKTVKSNNPAIERANQLFAELNMAQTAERNAVLIYLCFKPHYLAVIGDEGIHQKVGDEFWQAVYQAMREQAQNNAYTEAICAGIERVGYELAEHFPRKADDINELPNDVVIK